MLSRGGTDTLRSVPLVVGYLLLCVSDGLPAIGMSAGSSDYRPVAHVGTTDEPAIDLCHRDAVLVLKPYLSVLGRELAKLVQAEAQIRGLVDVLLVLRDVNSPPPRVVS